MLYNGDLSLEGTFMEDKNTHESRYNIFAKGRYEIDDFWLASMDINYASDGAYLKDLSLPGKTETWLTSRAAFERFENRNYASVEAYSYKLVSYSLREYHISEFERRDYSKPYIFCRWPPMNTSATLPTTVHTSKTPSAWRRFTANATKPKPSAPA